ncbi:MAG: transposase family protein [Spirochaetaceae bacterium]|jgi:hypothetical protein|nr:transposase family protein [Spirochaetaceae bacterium]
MGTEQPRHYAPERGSLSLPWRGPGKPGFSTKCRKCAQITLPGVLANAKEWNEIAAFATAKAEWLKSFLKLPNGIPLHDTIQRVMSMLDGSVLYSLSIQFLAERIDSLAEPGRRLKGGPEAEPV